MVGRTTLVKAVLSALPSYHVQTMLLPKKLLDEIEKKSRSFLWDDSEEHKKIHLVSWDQITEPKSKGVLVLRGRENKMRLLSLSFAGNFFARMTPCGVKS